MYDVVFEKAKGCGARVNRRSMLWEFSQNSQENIYAGISFLVFFWESYEISKNTFFAEQHRTTTSDYSSFNSSKVSTVMVSETANYDTKAKTHVSICARSVS